MKTAKPTTTQRKTAYTFTGSSYTIASDGPDTTTVLTLYPTCTCPTGLK